MTRCEAFKLLASESAHERLKAARFLARNAEPGDIVVLRRARQSETVSYVKTSLDTAISKSTKAPTRLEGDPADEINIPDSVKRQIRTRAVEEVAEQILHEIASPIGLVKDAASREVTNFDQSETKRYLDRLERIFDGIVQLKTATAAPRPEEFDLSELISEIVSSETGGEGLGVSLHGPRPMRITNDPRLLGLAISNGVRNAIEAIGPDGAAHPHSVVVAWGETDVDFWISIIDRGPGLVGPFEAAFEIGKSTKRGHSGFGLAIARQSMETIGGTVTLQPGGEGGARYELRWER